MGYGAVDLPEAWNLSTGYSATIFDIRLRSLLRRQGAILIEELPPPEIEKIPIWKKRIDRNNAGSDRLAGRIRVGAPHGYK